MVDVARHLWRERFSDDKETIGHFEVQTEQGVEHPVVRVWMTMDDDGVDIGIQL